ncbi:hypothetical protein LUZ60_004362 [Juncus effusus]|nr:hypothetical protein LUZ60_004362 [Juncus effusus]
MAMASIPLLSLTTSHSPLTNHKLSHSSSFSPKSIKTHKPNWINTIKLCAISPKNEGDSGNVTPQSATPATSFLSVLCPLLKFFGGGDPSKDRNEIIEVATSSISSLARFQWGSKSTNEIDKTQITSPFLQLYEFEACPFCRRVREALTELDLTAEIYPCPKGSLRHRDFVKKTGGKEQFPFLVDTRTGITIYESGEIVKYLFKEYGQGRNPSFGLLESTILTGWVPTLLRAGRGMTLWNKSGIEPSQKLLLFSYENNPYARLVREALCELELPYILQNVGDGSARSDYLFNISGSNKVPYLVDSNCNFQSGDYKRILQHLFQTYYSTESVPV